MSDPEISEKSLAMFEQFSKKLDEADKKRIAQLEAEVSNLVESRGRIAEDAERLEADLAAARAENEVAAQHAAGAESLRMQLDMARGEIERLKGRLKPRMDYVDGIPRGYGEDEIDRLREALRFFEWAGAPENAYRCGQCGQWRSVGHKPDCWMAALLEKGK